MPDHIVIGDIRPRVQYVADGTQSVFTYPFPIFAEADLKVYLGEALQGAGYTVGGAGQSAGGSVTFAPPPAAGTRVTLLRALAIARTSDFQEGGAFRAKTLNDELDRQTAFVQEVGERVERAIVAAPTESAAPLVLPAPDQRANSFLGFDGAGQVIASPGAGALPISAAMAPVVQAASLAAARDALGAMAYRKDNLAASAAPTANDDGTLGYGVGSLWIDLAAEAAYRCLDATPDAAVWHRESADGLVAQAEAEAGVASTPRYWSAERVKQAIAALGSGLPSVAAAVKTDTFSHNTSTFTDVTGLSVTITPSAASSRVMITVSVSVGHSAAGGEAFFRLMRDLTPIAVADAASNRIQTTFGLKEGFTVNGMRVASFAFVDSPATTSATTYKLQVAIAGTGGTAYINKSSTDTDNANNYRAASSIQAMEIAA